MSHNRYIIKPKLPCTWCGHAIKITKLPGLFNYDISCSNYYCITNRLKRKKLWDNPSRKNSYIRKNSYPLSKYWRYRRERISEGLSQGRSD